MVRLTTCRHSPAQLEPSPKPQPFHYLISNIVDIPNIFGYRLISLNEQE
jgi:hypothetical protein